jgi:hypothetical protein
MIARRAFISARRQQGGHSRSRRNLLTGSRASSFWAQIAAHLTKEIAEDVVVY